MAPIAQQSRTQVLCHGIHQTRIQATLKESVESIFIFQVKAARILMGLSLNIIPKQEWSQSKFSYRAVTIITIERIGREAASGEFKFTNSYIY